MFSSNDEENTERKIHNSYDVQQFEELRQKYHAISNKYQSKLSIEKDNLVEIEELRCCLENERAERKKENLKYEEERRRKEIQWKNEMENVRAESEDTLKKYKEKVEALEEELAAVKETVEKEKSRAEEMQSHAEYLTEVLKSEANKVVEAEMAMNEHKKQCVVLKEQLATAEERLMIKEEEVVNLKEKLESAMEDAVMYSSQMQEMKALQKEDEPADPHAKGNSLFAEVDDRRQRMKHQLVYERRKLTKIQHAYQSKCGRVKYLEEELIEMSRKWKDDLRETAISKENLITSFRSHIKDLEDKVERLQNEGSSTDGNFIGGMVTPMEELKYIEAEMDKARREVDELREKLTSASLERLLRDQDLFQLKGQLRRLRAENAYLQKLSERNNWKATEGTQEVITSSELPSSSNETDLPLVD